MHKRKKIVILGGGSHAEVLLSILQLHTITILGYTDHIKKRNLPIKYLGNDLSVGYHSPKDIQLVNGLGSTDLPLQRQFIYEKFKKLGYTFASVIHPSAILAKDVKLSEGVQLMTAVVINVNSQIGENSIINTGALIDHHCCIGKHSHIAPGVTLSGGIHIGNCCLIGAGTTIIQNISIGNQVVIGAGSVVIKNVLSCIRAAGVPARTISAA
ncbi:MAG: Sugar O-acyltransferase, sialic acid O-acetyltransferase NeuD family [Candidatus Nomurabacteria bacterium GW2011_GWA2_40_9]|uniref:Sugar O-acyltransferase, sialic acid O-acetyltransferase NeuD family n=1 Tax=Candidatus Nomurabacteria bacterium GW2011_GWA2_40_9 TaxID=1618734 RepID=A0A0G0W5L9_9BACT|nr:MAG: Sugar O-acyltransferase, sialic acid O-acetyltransferase NeuD family [Candidatus Nomurabacteria bacterium GW2011_GWA2_40_9]